MARIIDGEKKNLIGENLKKLRIKANMSQQALSNKLELQGFIFAVARSHALRIFHAP